MEYEVKDRNEWFEEVERAYSKLKIVERPYAPPHAALAVEAEDVLCCLGLTATAYIEDIKYCPFCGEEL